MGRVGVNYGRVGVPVYGGPSGSNRLSAVGGARPVPGSGHSLPTEHENPREGFCRANDNTCGARKAKGTDLCIGHLRSSGGD